MIKKNNIVIGKERRLAMKHKGDFGQQVKINATENLQFAGGYYDCLARQRIFYKKGLVHSMKKQYVTDDGKIFGTEKEAIDHENELAEIKAKRKELADKKQARKDEIQADCEALMKKIEQYNKDYSEPFTYIESKHTTPSSIVRDLFKIVDWMSW